MPMPEEKGARSVGKRKERESGACYRLPVVAGGVLDPRRSPRWIEMKKPTELAERMLKLKRELIHLTRHQRSYRDFVADFEAGKEAQPAMEEPEPQPAGAEKKRKKVFKMKVSQRYIDHLRENPYDKIFDVFTEEELAKRPQPFQACYAQDLVYSAKRVEYEQALVQQYLDHGFAEIYKEVSDDDEEN